MRRTNTTEYLHANSYFVSITFSDNQENTTYHTVMFIHQNSCSFCMLLKPHWHISWAILLLSFTAPAQVGPVNPVQCWSVMWLPELSLFWDSYRIRCINHGVYEYYVKTTAAFRGNWSVHCEWSALIAGPRCWKDKMPSLDADRNKTF